MVKLPDIDFSDRSIESIRRSRDLISGARAEAKAHLKALDGLAEALKSMCSHPNKSARYDPGYAGGGFSHYECPDCGGHITW